MLSYSPAVVAATMVELLPLLARASIESPNILPSPPMGFNNWARFECNLNQTLFTETADAMVSTGLRDAGYKWMNLDDCWMTHERGDDGKLQVDKKKFPNGLSWLGNYFKERGLKFGIYEDSGNATCGGYPGSYGYEKLDAETFASWGVEYLKLDGCNVFPKEGRTSREEYIERYKLWHQVLMKMEDPLIFSESAPAYFSGEKDFSDWYAVMDRMPIYGELARHSNDIIVYGTDGNAWDSVMTNYNFQILVSRYQKRGYYNDPDFLIPDNPGLSADEKKSQFALWASFGAPLIISAYVPNLTDDDIKFLTNKDLIEVDQDPLAEQAALVSRDDSFDVFTRTLSNGDRLLTVLNRGDSPANADIAIERVGLSADCSYKAKDLWTGETLTLKDSVSLKLNTHATAVYRISVPRKCATITPTGAIFDTASVQCLTEQTDTIAFGKCEARDSQVWQFTPWGSITPLSDTGNCMTATEGDRVSMEKCHHGANQQWWYSVHGELTNYETGQCLRQNGAGLGSCKEDNKGVFGLPAGVDVSW